MDKNSNAERSNSSAKRWSLDNLPTAAADETGEERSDLYNVNDAEMLDILSPGVEKRDELQGEALKLDENSVVSKNNKNSEDHKKDNCGSGVDVDSATAVEDNDYAESDTKSDEEAAELSDTNDPDTNSRVKKPNRRHNETRVSSSSSSSAKSPDLFSDDTADLPNDITSSFSSESELIPESEDIDDIIDLNVKLAYKYYDNDNATPDFLYTMQKPNYNWNQYQEIMYREHGLSGKSRPSLTKANAIAFQNRFYGARHVIEKMKLSHSLQDQQCTANCLHFNRAGNLIVSGSRDSKIILWDWSAKEITYAFNSEHESTVNQVKFIELGAGINIVSSELGGEVRHATIPPSGAKEPISRVLLKESGYTTKIALDINNPYEILTASENGRVKRCDLRQKPIELLVTVKEKKHKVGISSIAHHPLEQEFCVFGDKFIHIYDKRKTKEPVQMMCPQHLENEKNVYGSSTVYNSTGSEILASYNCEDIYIFNNKRYLRGQFSHRYKGHSNSTFKVVNFFGPNSEYVVSGSNCGNYFFWDKGTQSIINCIKFQYGVSYGQTLAEPHPSFPILATSDHDEIQIWMPLND